jgi:hypothetical protein
MLDMFKTLKKTKVDRILTEIFMFNSIIQNHKIPQFWTRIKRCKVKTDYKLKEGIILNQMERAKDWLEVLEQQIMENLPLKTQLFRKMVKIPIKISSK